MATATETQNLYEGMYIISAALSDEARTKALKKLEESITKRGGVIHKVHNWGRRRLAYEINKHREGYYFIFFFSVAPEAIAEMWVEYHLNEDLVRFFTTRADKVQEKIEFRSVSEEL